MAATLQAARNQTWANKEIIVVDDGSTDGSLAIAGDFESDTTTVITQTRRGAAAARNIALSRAKGALIQYLDADDLLHHEKVELQVQRLLSEPSGTVSTSAWARFNCDPDAARFVDQPDFRDYSDPLDWLIQSWNGRGTMPPAAWLLPRSIVSKTGNWNESLSLSDDTEYFTRPVPNSRRIGFCSEARSYYRSGNPNPDAIERPLNRISRSVSFVLRSCWHSRVQRERGKLARASGNSSPIKSEA